jgi:hypothetical protein
MWRPPPTLTTWAPVCTRPAGAPCAPVGSWRLRPPAAGRLGVVVVVVAVVAVVAAWCLVVVFVPALVRRRPTIL